MPKVVFNPLTQDFDFTGGGSSTWGSITGTLSSQTDLQNALNAKANDSDTVHKTGAETVAGSKTFSNDLSVNGTSYLSTTNVYGDLSMKTGTHLVLDSDPITNLQAATKQYVDTKANDSDVVKLTGNQTIAGTKTFSSDPVVPDEAYGIGWNSSLEVPTKNALYDKIESLGGITIDTKENILASTPTSPTVAFASDTDEFFVWDGTNWNIASISLASIVSGQDQGWTQGSDKQGYGGDYTDGKKHTTTGIGAFNGRVYEGAIKVDASNNPITFEIYLRGKWNKIFYDFQMVNNKLEHIPKTYTIDVRSGNSVELGLNGLPIVREYKVDQGVYPSRVIIDGGTL